MPYPEENSYEELYKRSLGLMSDDVALPEDDPALTKYRNLYSESNRGEALLKAHQAQRPDYGKVKVSFMDELGDALFAMMTNKPELINETRDTRYQRAYSKWVDEGKYINEVREALDKDKARELSGTQFEIRNKIAGEKQKRIQTQKDQDQALRMSAEAERNADRDLARGSLEESRKTNTELRKQGLDLRREANTRAAESAKLSQEAAKDRENKRELDLKGQARAMTKAQFTRDPSFAKYFTQGPDGEPIINPELPLPELQKIRYLMEHMENLNFAKLKRGALPR